ncbi:MAG: hypothetical protein MZW92_40660 [Comamonadaceae bacterium]|nr:hypothetical protein [Comamonadaceae bacterium]
MPPVAGGGWEADFAEAVLLKAKAQLEGISALQEERVVRVVQGEESCGSTRWMRMPICAGTRCAGCCGFRDAQPASCMCRSEPFLSPCPPAGR